MDVHKESIDVTLAEEGGEVYRLGQIGERKRGATRLCGLLTQRVRQRSRPVHV
jgi:hypothetical protein